VLDSSLPGFRQLRRGGKTDACRGLRISQFCFRVTTIEKNDLYLIFIFTGWGNFLAI
jgi:hypothetical protein